MTARDREGRHSTGAQGLFARTFGSLPSHGITAVRDEWLVRRRRQATQINARRCPSLGDQRAIQPIHFSEIDFGRLGQQVLLRVRREFVEKRKNLRLSSTLKFSDKRMSG